MQFNINFLKSEHTKNGTRTWTMFNDVLCTEYIELSVSWKVAKTKRKIDNNELRWPTVLQYTCIQPPHGWRTNTGEFTRIASSYIQMLSNVVWSEHIYRTGKVFNTIVCERKIQSTVCIFAEQCSVLSNTSRRHTNTYWCRMKKIQALAKGSFPC